MVTDGLLAAMAPNITVSTDPRILLANHGRNFTHFRYQVRANAAFVRMDGLIFQLSNVSRNLDLAKSWVPFPSIWTRAFTRTVCLAICNGRHQNNLARAGRNSAASSLIVINASV